MKPKYNAVWSRSQNLVTAIVICFGASFAQGAENLWTGTTDSQWNTPTNWSAGHIPEKAGFDEDAAIRTSTGNIATIVGANILKTPKEILIGNLSGTTGLLNHISGDALTGVTNAMYVGRNGGTGIYNLANTAVPDLGISGFAQGSGNMIVNGAFYSGSGTGGSGTVNMNTTGTLSAGGNGIIGDACIGKMNLQSGSFSVGSEFWVGQGAGGNGEFKMTNGAVSISNWVAIGRQTGTGKVIVNGGTFTKNNTGGSFAVGNGGGSKGEMEQSAGTVTVNSVFRVADETGVAGSGKYTMTGGTLDVKGECWIGQGGSSAGTMTVSGSAVITNNNWVAVGRQSGTGVLNMSGGSWTKTGGGDFVIGSYGAGSTGTATISGGTLSVNSLIQISEGGGADAPTGTSTLNISGTAQVSSSRVIVGNGAAIGTGILNLTGGTLTTGQIIDGTGNSTATFAGGQIVATGNQAAFITSLNTATLTGLNGLKINSNGFTLTVPQLLAGGGGLLKSGDGVLTLTGANTYTGATSIAEAGGKLITTTASDATGAVTLGDFAGFGVTQTTIDEVYNTSALTFAANDNTLDLNLGAFPGNTANAPLNVTGTLTVNGDVTLKIADTNMVASGTPIPLISYTGPKAGGGNFVFGTGSLPDGVIATLNDTGTSPVSLTVTRANDPYWNGPGILWNTTDANWLNEFGGVATNFADGDPALFDDRVAAAGPIAVELNVEVAPGGSGVTFNNITKNYTLNGSGKITGATGLLKLGAGSVSIATANDYAGATTITAGTINIATFPNTELPSPIGQDNLLRLNGGTLNYTGGATTTDRGFTVSAVNGAISTTNSLTMSGEVFASGGGLIKLGAGNLTLDNDTITLSSINQVSRVNGGTLTLTGPGTSTVNANGELWVGSTPAASGNLVLQGRNLTVGSWFTLGRGNGNTGILSTFTATDSIIQTGNISVGFNGDLGSNDSDQTITLTNSTWTNSGLNLFGESQNNLTNITFNGASSFTGAGESGFAIGQGSICNLTLNGTSTFTANGLVRMARNATAVCNVLVQNNAALSVTAGYFSIGDAGTAVVTVKDSGSLTVANSIDFNISDVGTSNGTLNIQDNATVTATGVVFVGKNGTNITTGTTGTVNMTGGTFNTTTYISLARRPFSTGVFNMDGGTVNQTDPGAGFIVGEHGNGTLNVNGGAINIGGGGLYLTAETGGEGVAVVNLNGGTVTAKRVSERDVPTGTSTLNLNGGLLKAQTGASLSYIDNLNSVIVKSGGAKIDTNGETIGINQPMLDGTGGGGLTKTGAGFLQLNSANTYTGTTLVSAGSFGGTGSVAGPLTVSPGATLAPGTSIGTFAAGATTISGTYACEIGGANADKLVANGTLTINGGSTLAISQVTAPSASVLVIASYTGATPAEFTTVTGVPSGYSLVYNYGGNQIALVGPVTAYNTWAAANITAINPLADASKGGDPDNDGLTNVTEFALNSVPLSGAASGKVRGSVSPVGGSPALVLTLPVRTGASFSGSTQQVSGLIDDVIYTIQGSDQLTAWDLIVSEVGEPDKSIIQSTMPPLDTGWSYRTFRSPGTTTGDPTDFLRAVITAP